VPLLDLVYENLRIQALVRLLAGRSEAALEPLPELRPGQAKGLDRAARVIELLRPLVLR
jgi:hypothetical protein